MNVAPSFILGQDLLRKYLVKQALEYQQNTNIQRSYKKYYLIMREIMRKFKNLKIAKKLVISFIIVAILAGVVGVVGIINIQKINKLDTDLYERHTATLDDVAYIIMDYQKERSIVRDLLIMKDDTQKQQQQDSLTDLDKEMEAHLAIFEASIKDAEVKKTYESLKSDLSDFKSYRDKEISLIASGKTDQAAANLYTTGTALSKKIESDSEQLLKLKVDLAKQASENNDQSAFLSSILMIIIIVIAVILAIVLGLYLAKIISFPINKMVEAAKRLSVGDVTADVDVDIQDEVGELADSLKEVILNIRSQAEIAEKIADGDLSVEVPVRSDEDLLGKKLHQLVVKNNEVLSDINIASDQVAVGSRQVSDASVALSQGASEQASTIEELTASLEEISAQTRQNAQNAEHANELAELAKTNAADGNAQMREMQNAMEEINVSSSNISKIIKVIDEIAFQTNILALNAAVEAARAGDAGKGFAVVAEEVRNLAARSADAANETTDLIEGSVNKVNIGTKIANDTAEALDKIVEGVAQAADLVSEIATASSSQAAAITQINQGIVQVSQVVQANSATAEESAAASEELSGQADLLRQAVSNYKLKAADKPHYSAKDETAFSASKDHQKDYEDRGAYLSGNGKYD